MYLIVKKWYYPATFYIAWVRNYLAIGIIPIRLKCLCLGMLRLACEDIGFRSLWADVYGFQYGMHACCFPTYYKERCVFLWKSELEDSLNIFSAFNRTIWCDLFRTTKRVNYISSWQTG